jgi:hypothetical protein
MKDLKALAISALIVIVCAGILFLTGWILFCTPLWCVISYILLLIILGVAAWMRHGEDGDVTDQMWEEIKDFIK